MIAVQNLSLSFAREILAIGSGGLSHADQDQVRYLLLDCLGVSRVGATLAWTRAMTEWAGRFAGSAKHRSPAHGSRWRRASRR
jgi:hypothetical protein